MAVDLNPDIIKPQPNIKQIFDLQSSDQAMGLNFKEFTKRANEEYKKQFYE